MSAPVERRFIMRGPEVLATLAGMKTQCRRPTKPQPAFIESSGRWSWPIPKRFHSPGCATEAVTASREWWEYLPDGCCPFGKPGDRLWVAETWCSPSRGIVGYAADGGCGAFIGDGAGSSAWLHHGRIIESPGYSKGFPESGDRTYGLAAYGGRWRPASTMPRRAACRLVLELVDIRAERLRDISDEDAAAEGWHSAFGPGMFYRAFDSYWDGMFGKKFPYASSPWVWVPTYKVLKGASP